MGELVQRRRVLDKFPPVGGGMHVHFNDAGIGRDLDVAQPWIRGGG